jgi:hypothetical protein
MRKTHLIQCVIILNLFEKRSMKITCNWKNILNKEVEDDKEL